MGEKMMEFNRAVDAINYITENNLLNTPVSLDLHLDKKPKVEVWFGTMETGRFSILDDYFQMCVIHDIAEKIMLEDDDNVIEDYLSSNAYESYLIPLQFDGEIVYSSQFVKDNGIL